MTELTDEQSNHFSTLCGLRTALGSLHHARSSIKLPEIIPESDVARHWLLITGIFSLLEQSLKFLLKLTQGDYRHGHDLSVVYRELPEGHRDILRQYFDEYASLQGITGLDGLDQYLQEKGSEKRYGRWRYFLIEGSLEKLDQGQTGPLHPDLLLETIQGALDLIDRLINDHTRINSVSWRLENSIDLAPYGSSGTGEEWEDIQAWLKDNPCLINACSRWLRAGDLDDYATPLMRNWVADTMSASVDIDTTRDQQLGTHRQLGIAYDMAIFKHRATRSGFTWDGKQFVSRNPRPAPVNDLYLQGDWRLEWEADGARWTCGLSRAVTQIPTRPGQTIRVVTQCTLQDEDGNPMSGDTMASQPTGVLTLTMNGQRVERMPAQIYLYSGSGQEPFGEPPHYRSILFVRTDDGGAYEKLRYKDFTCANCRGTGFYPDCLGECEEGDCDCGNGLCGECKGYGEDGDHLLARIARLSAS